MRSSAQPSRSKGSLVMAMTLFTAVTAWVSLDVVVAELRIDPADSSTWPEMGPAVRLFLVPELTVLLILVALLVNFALGIGTRRSFTRLAHWVVLGLAYSLPALSLFIAHLGAGFWPAVAMTSLSSVWIIWLVVSRFGLRVEGHVV
jgi:hypothetical protein